MTFLRLEPLEKSAFAPFGEVVTLEGRDPIVINKGFARRFNDLAGIETVDGATNVSLFATTARKLPLTIDMMERHPLGSQLFFPLHERPWALVVCDNPQERQSYRAFQTKGPIGVNYARNTWHFPLITFNSADLFLVIDRKGGGINLEERFLDPHQHLSLLP